jgi:hypothetical protein
MIDLIDKVSGSRGLNKFLFAGNQINPFVINNLTHKTVSGSRVYIYI